MLSELEEILGYGFEEDDMNMLLSREDDRSFDALVKICVEEINKVTSDSYYRKRDRRGV